MIQQYFSLVIYNKLYKNWDLCNQHVSNLSKKRSITRMSESEHVVQKNKSHLFKMTTTLTITALLIVLHNA